MDAVIGKNPFPDRAGIYRSQKTDGQNHTDPTAFKKSFGDKSLDQVLNGMSDPSYGSKTKRVHGFGNPELGKDAFFKLMLEQLKQQDPTNPLKSHEMAAQLAQFSSVEQLSNINDAIAKLSNKDDGSQYQMLNLIGKVISGDSSKVKRVAGDKEHRIEFSLAGDAEAAIVRIKDASGNEVKKYEVANLKAGKNQIVWGGLNEEGKEAPVGDYRAEISASNGGMKVISDTQFKGPVTGVQFTATGALLMVGNKTVSLRDIQRIEMGQGQTAPAAMAPAHAMPATQLVAPEMPVSKPIDLNKKYSQGAFEPKPVLANLDQAKMDNALKDKLLKK